MQLKCCPQPRKGGIPCFLPNCPFCRKEIKLITSNRGRVEEIRHELSVPPGAKIAVEALWLLWHRERNSFNKREASYISGLNPEGISKALEAAGISPKKIGQVYAFTREEAISLRSPKNRLDSLRLSHYSLAEASKLCGIEPSSITDLITKGLIPVNRSTLGDRVFLDEETVRRILAERAELLSVSAASRASGVSRAAINRAIAAGKIRAIKTTTMRRTSLAIPPGEVQKLPDVIGVKYRAKSHASRQ